MGGICSKGQPVAQAEDDKIKEHELDKRIKDENTSEKNVQKLLLLGAGESGKSTIFKQIKVLYKTGFNDDELKDHIPVIHANVYQSIKVLYDGCVDLRKSGGSELYLFKPGNEEHGKRISEIGEGLAGYPKLSPEEGQIISNIWNDPAIQATYQKANELQLPDCTEYFLNDVNRLATSTYRPTKEDILYARVRTTGVADIEFQHGGRTYRIFDVGGQRNERRKWIHLFDGVKAVIFCAALSEYDQFLFEDETKNRMMETKELFEWVVKEPSFQKTAFLVFLNKYDIFKRKALTVPLTVCEWFRDYEPISGDQAKRIDHAYEYIKKKFEEIHQKASGQGRLCFIYKTTALDQNLMKTTFELVDRQLLIETMANL